MDEARRNEIAYTVLVGAVLPEEAIRLDKKFIRRKVGELSSKIGVPIDELMAFAEAVYRDLLERAFPSS